MKPKKELIDQYFREKSQTDITQLEFAQKHKITGNTFLRWLQKDPRYQRTYVKYTQEERKNKVDEFFKLNQETDITQLEFAQKHNIKPVTLLYWLQKDPRYQRTNVVYNQEERKNKVDEFFKLNQETDISQSEFTKKHKITGNTLNRWLLKDPRYQRTNVVYNQEERKNKVDEFFKLNQETDITQLEFAQKHNINPYTLSGWLLRDPRYQRQRTTVVPHKEPALATSMKQHLDKSKEKNAETVYDNSTLINDYIDSPIYSDDLDQYLQPDTSQMTPDISWYSSQENLSMFEESLAIEDQPSTSQMTPDNSWYSSEENLSMIEESLAVVDQPSTSNQTNLENKIKNAKITANQSNRNHPYNKPNLDRAFR